MDPMCSNKGCSSTTSAGIAERAQKLRLAQCVKCRGLNGPPALLVRKDEPPLCRVCFLTASLHKFKSAFGKSNVIPKQSKVAVAFSGGRSSLIMVDLLRQHTNRHFIPKLFHVVEPGATQAELDLIVKLMESTGFEFLLLDPGDINVSISRFRSETCFLTDSLITMKNLPELDIWSQRNLLVECSRFLDCQFLCLGESGTIMANQFIMGLVQGRGGQAASSARFIDNRFGDVAIIRPLLQFLAKELVFYAHFANLQPVVSRTSLTDFVLERPDVTTLPILCENFLAELQSGGFPSTTQTILRTASKLSLLDEVDSVTAICLLCKDPICTSSTTSAQANLAMTALAVSQVLSRGDEPSSANLQPGCECLLDQSLCPGCAILCGLLPSQLRRTFEKAFLESVNGTFDDG